MDGWLKMIVKKNPLLGDFLFGDDLVDGVCGFDTLGLSMAKKQVVVIGGGSGIKGLVTEVAKHQDWNATAIIPLVDDGGSTGRLRSELNVSPAGDARSLLIAASPESPLRDALAYRFSEGDLSGHNAGNVLIAALEKQLGFESAIQSLSEALNTSVRILPATSVPTVLSVTVDNKTITGEHHIENGSLPSGERVVTIEPSAVNPAAVEAIQTADVIIIGPGSLYESILSTLCIPELSHAIQTSPGLLVYNANVLEHPLHTKGFHVEDLVSEIERYTTRSVDFTLYHNIELTESELSNRSELEGEQILPSSTSNPKLIGADLLQSTPVSQSKEDAVIRSRLVHDGEKLLTTILNLL